MEKRARQMADDLHEWADHVEAHAKAKDEKERVEAELEAVKKELEEVKAELKSGQAGVAKASLANQKKLEADLHSKSTELVELQKRVDAAQHDYDQLMAQSRDARAHYNTILAGIEALKARLEGKG